MNRLRSALLTGLGVVCLLSVSARTEAQYYGGGYGGYGYGGGIGGGYGFRQYGGSMGNFAPPNSIGGYYPQPYSTIFPGYRGGIEYPGYYGIGAQPYGAGYGIGGPVIAPNPGYGTTTTIIRGGPTGGVLQYSNNGNGYSYMPDSTYPTVIQQQPTLGLSRTVVVPSPPPVVRTIGNIKLICPKAAGGPLTYSLNGHVYTIQPGYSQTFRDDRPWTLEFMRGGEGSEAARYSLKAGTYSFAVGTSGWELHQPGESLTNDLPPAPLPDPASPTAPSAIPSLPPSPLPPP